MNLASTGHGVRIFSVVPSLDTPVCDAQTKRFNEEASKLPELSIYTFSMDLPFAQKRWCGAYGVDHVKMISDHRTGSFGENYGTLIKELHIHSRAIFVLDKDDTLRHVEYVKEVGRIRTTNRRWRRLRNWWAELRLRRKSFKNKNGQSPK